MDEAWVVGVHGFYDPLPFEREKGKESQRSEGLIDQQVSASTAFTSGTPDAAEWTEVW